MGEMNEIPPAKRAGVAALGTQFIMIMLIKALLSKGQMLPSDVKSIADEAPDDDVGHYVRSTLQPFLELGD